jgi:hypothetical protein
MLCTITLGNQASVAGLGKLALFENRKGLHRLEQPSAISATATESMPPLRKALAGLGDQAPLTARNGSRACRPISVIAVARTELPPARPAGTADP